MCLQSVYLNHTRVLAKITDRRDVISRRERSLIKNTTRVSSLFVFLGRNRAIFFGDTTLIDLRLRDQDVIDALISDALR